MSVRARLEYSDDPLTGPAAAWENVTGKLISATFGDGKSESLDDPSAGTLSLTLRDPERDFEPENAGGFLPEPLHRFRLFLSDPAELAANPGFDSSLTGWTVYSFLDSPPTNTRDTAVYRTGPASLRVDCTVNTGWKGSETTISGLTVGRTYAAYVWAKADPADVGAGFNLYVAVTGDPQINVILTAAWQLVEVPFTASATSATLYVRTNSPNTTFYVDDVSVVRMVQQGLWYAGSYTLRHPTGLPNYAEVDIDAVDGAGILSLARLLRLSPPAADSYEDVVTHDQPFLYVRLGEQSGTAVPAVAGPEGVFQHRTLVTLAQAGAIVGDSDTAVRFQGSGTTQGRARFPLTGTENLNDTDEVTIEVWAKLATVGVTAVFATGPATSGGFPIWQFGSQLSSGNLEFLVHDAAGAYAEYTSNPSLTSGVWHHLVVSWDHGLCRMWKDGAEQTVTVAGGVSNMDAPAASTFLYVGNDAGASGTFECTLDELAVYEHALTPERILAHYEAGAQRGFPSQAAGARVAALATTDLWAETEIEAGGPLVDVLMQTGQTRWEELVKTVKDELPTGLLFFDGEGRPVHLARDFQTDPYYSTPQVVLAGPAGVGEVGYRECRFRYDDDLFNIAIVANEAGLEVTRTDSASVDKRFEREKAETGLRLLSRTDLETAAAAIVDLYADPRFRIEAVTLHGGRDDQAAQLVTRTIGDMVRVKHAVPGSGLIDVITHILGRSLTFHHEDGLSGTWNLARGFDASQQVWRLGVAGYSELGQTTYLG